MTATLALITLLAQDPVLGGDRSLFSKCAVSDDAEYGYTSEKPIRVGGGRAGGYSRQRAYLQALVGPAGQAVSFRPRRNMKNADGVIVDLYEVTYAGLRRPAELYLEREGWDPPKAPRGFICGFEIDLAVPEPGRGHERMVMMALRKSLNEEIPPIPLGADGSTRHGIAVDAFRFIAANARELAAAGKTLPPQIAAKLNPREFMVVAYPLACGAQLRKPRKIDVLREPRQPLSQLGGWLTDAAVGNLLTWEKIPDGSLGSMFVGEGLPIGGEVVITYDGDACPGGSNTVTLPVVAGPPTKIVDVTPVAPVGATLPPGGRVEVRVRVTIDVEGVPSELDVLSGPSEFNRAATDAIRQWHYKLFTINGQPSYTPTVTLVTVTFGNQ